MSDTTAAGRPPTHVDRLVRAAIAAQVARHSGGDPLLTAYAHDLQTAWEMVGGSPDLIQPTWVDGLPAWAAEARPTFILQQTVLLGLLGTATQETLSEALGVAFLEPLNAAAPGGPNYGLDDAYNATRARLTPFLAGRRCAPGAVRPDPTVLAASIAEALAAGFSLYPAPGGQCEGFEGDDMVRSAWAPDPDPDNTAWASTDAARWVRDHPGCNALAIVPKGQGVLCFDDAKVEAGFQSRCDLLGLEAPTTGPVVKAPSGQVFALVSRAAGPNRNLAPGVRLLTGPAVMPLPGSVDAQGRTFASRAGCDLLMPAPAIPRDVLKHGLEIGWTRDQASTLDAQARLEFYAETLGEMLTEARYLADRKGDRSSDDVWREFRRQLVAWVAEATGTGKGVLSDDIRALLSGDGDLAAALDPARSTGHATPDKLRTATQAAIDAALRDLALVVLRETPPSATGTPIRAIEPGAAGSTAPLDHVMPGVTIRRFVTITAALRGLNKTGEAVVRAVSVATGLSLLGDACAPAVRGRVVIFAGEDGADDWRRHVEAAIAHYRLERSEVWANLQIITQPRLLTVGGRVLPAEVVRIVDYLRANAAVAAIFDPLKSFHDANENDPGAADHVMKRAFSPIAQRANCAVELIHHFTKSAGDDAGIEAVRGAGAWIDAARVGRVITPMSDQDASRFGLDDDEAADVRRVRLARYSFGPSGATTWIKVVPVLLASGAWAHTVEQWTPPAAFLPWTLEDVAAVQDIIAAGGPGGRGFRHSHQADGWAGEVIAEVMGLDVGRKADRIRATRLLDQWVKDGWLKRIELARDDGKRKVPFVQVGRSAADQPLEA